jgi:hypothetical protein
LRRKAKKEKARKRRRGPKIVVKNIIVSSNAI